jgi:hypothetical protein
MIMLARWWSLAPELGLDGQDLLLDERADGLDPGRIGESMRARLPFPPIGRAYHFAGRVKPFHSMESRGAVA